MISVEEARVILDDDKLSDQEVQDTIDYLELLADLMFDQMRAERKAKREKEMAEVKSGSAVEIESLAMKS